MCGKIGLLLTWSSKDVEFLALDRQIQLNTVENWDICLLFLDCCWLSIGVTFIFGWGKLKSDIAKIRQHFCCLWWSGNSSSYSLYLQSMFSQLEMSNMSVTIFFNGVLIFHPIHRWFRVIRSQSQQQHSISTLHCGSNCFAKKLQIKCQESTRMLHRQNPFGCRHYTALGILKCQCQHVQSLMLCYMLKTIMTQHFDFSHQLLW